jgi:hypothetical protein
MMLWSLAASRTIEWADRHRPKGTTLAQTILTRRIAQERCVEQSNNRQLVRRGSEWKWYTAADIDQDNRSPNNTVGGTVGVTPGGACTGECNVITGNQDQSAALYIMGAASTGNVVIGNFVGLLADGHTPNANRVVGVRLSGAPNNRLGERRPPNEMLYRLIIPPVS